MQKDEAQGDTVVEQNERPPMGDLNTIARGFAGGGVTNSTRKRYSRVLVTVAKAPPTGVADITFSVLELLTWHHMKMTLLFYR